MRNSLFTEAPKQDRRFQAVLSLLAGGKASEVAARCGIARSDLFKFKRRALDAMRAAMADKRRGPKRPANRLPEDREQRVRAACERWTTFSAAEIRSGLGDGAPSVRTIQRIRKRLTLPRLSKRRPPERKRRRFTHRERRTIRATVRAKLFLGPLRLQWEICNQHGITVGQSTVQRVKVRILNERKPKPPVPLPCRRYERKHPHSLWHGDLLEKVTLTDEDVTAYQLTLLDDYSRAYVFCDLFRMVTGATVLASIIAAMRAYHAIPKAILFDNGRYFRSGLIRLFCERLGIRVIHSTPFHPQTNGKLERAFRDDMSEFYRQRDRWIFDDLHASLPEYVAYRNTIRGHYALGGRPAIERLREQNVFALPSLLDHLESYAWRPRKAKTVAADGTIPLNGRAVLIDPALARTRVVFYETLAGLEAEPSCGQSYLLPLPDYQRLRYENWGVRAGDPSYQFTFIPWHPLEKFGGEVCEQSPRIAVAG